MLFQEERGRMARDLGETLREHARAAEAEQKSKGKKKSKVIEENLKSIKEDTKKKVRESRDVVYDEKGNMVKGRMRLRTKVIIGILSALAVFCVSIYIPPLFHRDSSGAAYIPIISDASALKTAAQYYKDRPDDDFDKDGLTNIREDQYGTNGWRADTDFDGIDDYAELYVTESNPKKAGSELVEQTQLREKERNESLKTPYKIDGIILWPDDYSSKAYGGVVRTANGVRFCHYKGWVKFPQKVYAYAYINGLHKELLYRENAEAWHITDNYEVRLYDVPLSFSDELILPFTDSIYLETGQFTDMLADILPDKDSFITCRRIADIDTQPDVRQDHVNALRQPHIDRTDEERLTGNQNTLDDYMFLRDSLDKGQCIAASLFSDTSGESICIIYGYDADGNLLAANESLEPVGKIYIVPTAMRMMNKDGEIGQVSWYEWYGLGFNSYTNNDRINYISSTATAGSDEEVQE